MKWLLIIVAIPVLVVCAFVVLVWITKPRKHRGVRYAVLSIVLRQLASPLHNGGTIYLEHADVEGTIQVRMRRYKTRPDQLLFRFRNADKTSPAFEQVVAALDRDKIPFDTELTKIRKRPRAVVVDFDATQAASYANLAHLTKLCLHAMGATADERLTAWAVDSFEGVLRGRPYAAESPGR
jgi:hypothetical protein